MQRSLKLSPKRGVLVRIGMLASLTFAGLSLSGCIFYAPPHYHYRGY